MKNTKSIEEILKAEERDRLEYESKTRIGEYTIAEMREAFDEIADPQDWKAPINATATTREEVDLAIAAIEFFTATKATVQKAHAFAAPHKNALVQMAIPIYIITSEGYRNGPAGP